MLGTDNRLGYWDTVTGDQIRSVEACRRGRLTAMDLSPDGMSVTHATIQGFPFGPLKLSLISFLFNYLCLPGIFNKLFVGAFIHNLSAK